MNCLVCDSNKEVKNLGVIYTIGSEGTNLCIDCRIRVSNYIRGLMSLANKIESDITKKYYKTKKGD